MIAASNDEIPHIDAKDFVYSYKADTANKQPLMHDPCQDTDVGARLTEN